MSLSVFTAALSSSAVAQEPTRGATERLRVDGRRMLQGADPFVWRGFTAFSLVRHVADDREAAAVEALDWAAGAGFNVARVLGMIDWDPRWLTPEAGARAL